jgi:hypothetical protein
MEKGDVNQVALQFIIDQIKSLDNDLREIYERLGAVERQLESLKVVKMLVFAVSGMALALVFGVVFQIAIKTPAAINDYGLRPGTMEPQPKQADPRH